MLASLPRPEVILTHESDLDGLVSGLLLQRLARKLHGETVPLEAWNYQAWQKRQLKETSAWVCDLAFEQRLDKPGWAVLDHHPTEVKAQHALLLHDTGKSAGRLCYEQCQAHELGSDKLDRLVQLNDVADLFLEDDPDFVTANDHANLVKTYGFWNLHDLIEGDLERLIDHPLLEVMAVKRRVEDPLGYEWAKGNVTELSPTVGYVRSVVGNVNLIVHRLLEQQATQFPVLLTLFRKANGSIIVSLRSRNGEAQQVAKQLQGGGHPNAAGATLPRSVQYIPDAVDYLQRVLDPPKDKGKALNSLESLLAGFEAKK
jgi:oligoribonuclease NrnB/cAMP/cGMP phosphodiesterase (DHH superfamily)